MSQRYKVVLTADAKKDITDIDNYIYYTLKAPIAAESNARAIRSAIKKLDYFPQKCNCCLEPELFELGIREQNVKQYAITFVIDEQSKRVIVLRVLHTLVNQHLGLYSELGNE